MKAESENGASLKASGFVLDDITNGGSWNCPSRPREQTAPTERKSVGCTCAKNAQVVDK